VCPVASVLRGRNFDGGGRKTQMKTVGSGPQSRSFDFARMKGGKSNKMLSVHGYLTTRFQLHTYRLRSVQ
jgi:hypothetical protein